MSAEGIVATLADVWADAYERPDPKDWARCITHTKRAVAVLAKLGVPSKACAVRVIAANAAALPVIFRVPVSEWPPEAWSVGIMLEDIPAESIAEPFRQKARSVHVVVRGDGWMFDPTARQLHRPHRDIHVPGPFFSTVAEGAEMCLADLSGGGLLVYAFQPKVAAFRTTNAWMDADLSHVPALVEETERRLGVRA